MGLLWGALLGGASYFASSEVAYFIRVPEAKHQRNSDASTAASSPGERESRGRLGRFENVDKPVPKDEGVNSIIAFLILLIAGGSIGALLPSGPRGSFLLGGLAIAAPGIVLSLLILAMTAAFPS